MNIHSGHFDMLSFVTNYEAGELADDDVIDGFQHMVDDGSAWQLQGSYGRTAATLIEAGLVTRHEP